MSLKAEFAAFGSPRKLKRAYIRRGTNNAPGIKAPTSPPQIAELAFNIHGWAMEDGMRHRETFEIINAYKATMVKGGFEAKIRELERDGVRNIYRQDLTYTSRERNSKLASTDTAVAQYLVVGYTLQEDDPIFKDNKTFARYSENELVGETQPIPDNMIPWQSVLTPILVVTPIKENTGTSVRLFGLIMPRSGLCQPVLLTHERIFYRWEFRASAGARPAQRNKNWNQVIIDKARELTPPEQLASNNTNTRDFPMKSDQNSSPTIKQEEDNDAMLDGMIGNGSELLDQEVFELYLDLGMLFEGLNERYKPIPIPAEDSEVMTRLKLILNDEVRGILGAIRKSRSSRVSQQVKASFVKVSQGSKNPSVQWPGLTHFAYPGAVFGRAEAQLVVSEINHFWPRFSILGILDVNSILRIKQSMDEAQLSVNFEAMKEFFRLALSHVKAFPNTSSNELQHKLFEIIQTSAAISQTTNLSIDDTESIAMDAVFLVTLLKEMVIIHDWQEQTTRPMVTGRRPGTFATIDIEHYLNMDSIEQATDDLPNHIKLLVGYARAKRCGVDDILLWLERLRLRIRQVAAE